MSVVTSTQRTGHRPSYLAFSDVDETLIDRKSMFDFMRFQLVSRYGATGEEQYRRTAQELQRKAAAGAPRSSVNRDYYRHYAGESAALVEALGREWFEVSAAEPGFFIRDTLDQLAEHRAAGAEIVLVSGSFLPCLAPIAERVGAAHVLCTTPIVLDGVYTGEVVEPVIGEGKRSAVLRILAEHPGVSPLACYAFGDHPSDFPMLDCVGNPRGVGDDPLMRAYLDRRNEGARNRRQSNSGCAVACWSMADGHEDACQGDDCAFPLG